MANRNITRLRIVFTLLFAISFVPTLTKGQIVASGKDCASPNYKTRIFKFNLFSGAWKFSDRCTGATREGIGEIQLEDHIWKIYGPSLLCVWDDRLEYGFASIFPSSNSDQWQPIACRFRPVLNDDSVRISESSRDR